MHDVTSALLKDKTAWIGGGSSIIATAATRVQSVQFPTTLEGWAAFTLSFVTIVYIITKIVILIKNHRNGVKQDL